MGHTVAQCSSAPSYTPRSRVKIQLVFAKWAACSICPSVYSLNKQVLSLDYVQGTLTNTDPYLKMDQVLSQVSRGKLSNKEKKADKRGVDRASWELRERGFSWEIKKGFLEEEALEGRWKEPGPCLGWGNCTCRCRKESTRCSEKRTYGPPEAGIGCEKGRGITLNGPTWLLYSSQSVGLHSQWV